MEYASSAPLLSDSFSEYDDIESAGIWRSRHNEGRSYTLALTRQSIKKIAIPVLTVSLTLSVIVNVVLLLATPSRGNQKPVCDGNSTIDCSDYINAVDNTPGNTLYSVLPGRLDQGRPPQPCLTDYPESMESGSGYENIFRDLSAEEINNVYEYLLGQPDLRIVRSNKTVEGSVYGIELHVPSKWSVLKFFKDNGPRPPREARVLIKHLDRTEPIVAEYVVGPLPKPSYYRRNPHRERTEVPYRFHPTYGIRAAYYALGSSMPNDMHKIIEESYGASLKSCQKNCLAILPQKTSSAYSERTVILLYLTYETEFPTVYPLGMIFLMKETAPGSEHFQCESMFYGGEFFSSMREFVRAYQNNKVKKIKMEFPRSKPSETSPPATMNLRGKTFPKTSRAGPKEFEPDGRRYRVTDQHIEYMEWSFNYRISTASGPQVWDVQWSGERIAYEISLQDLGVIYAGNNPASFYTHLSDSAFGIGNKAYGLVPGVDCPEHATFLDQNVFDDTANKAATLHNSFCVFEHNTGVPLRRHNSNEHVSGSHYGGLVDRVLVVRTIIVEFNYDYIFDMIFHQNGAVELKTYATGFVMSQAFQDGDDRFGFRITDSIVGSIHQHLLNFKVDLDIKGQSNRYETLDLTLDERAWPWHKSGTQPFQQMSFKHTLRETEQQAVFRYNFSTPKYHIVYNNMERNEFGVHRAYRMSVDGFSKVLFPDESPVLASRRWSKYQMVTTRRKDVEESSSSIFSMFDGINPHVDIDRYLQDNENIVDQDLVFWVTVGFHHIPHTEDIPNTPTVGTQATISLLPYNYFTECPSVGSRDAVRADVRNDSVEFQNYGISSSSQCLPMKFDFSYLQQNKSYLFP